MPLLQGAVGGPALLRYPTLQQGPICSAAQLVCMQPAESGCVSSLPGAYQVYIGSNPVGLQCMPSSAVLQG